MNASASIRIAPGRMAGKYKLRVQDYLLLDEAGSFHGTQTELVDGDVIVMSPEWMPHMRIKDEIAYRLRRAIEALALDLRVGTGGSVQLSENDQPRPDVIVMRPVNGTGAVPREAVLLLVEVAATTLAFDLNEKAPLYARHTIEEYWAVDVRGLTVHCYSAPENDGYRHHEEIRFGTPITSTTIDGVVIETSDL